MGKVAKHSVLDNEETAFGSWHSIAYAHGKADPYNGRIKNWAVKSGKYFSVKMAGLSAHPPTAIKISAASYGLFLANTLFNDSQLNPSGVFKKLKRPEGRFKYLIFLA